MNADEALADLQHRVEQQFYRDQTTSTEDAIFLLGESLAILAGFRAERDHMRAVADSACSALRTHGKFWDKTYDGWSADDAKALYQDIQTALGMLEEMRYAPRPSDFTPGEST